MTIITNRSETVVMTIVDNNRRWRMRRYSRMIDTMNVLVDPRVPVGAVRYRDFESYDESVLLLRAADGKAREYDLDERDYLESGVLVRKTVRGDIIDIEILDVDDPVMVALARDYAADNDLAFPRDLRAAAKMFA